MLNSGTVGIPDAEVLCRIKERAVLLDVLKQHPEMKLTSRKIRELSRAGALTEGVSPGNTQAETAGHGGCSG